MNPYQSRQLVVLTLLCALAVGAGSLLVPEPASAMGQGHTALFRVQRSFHGAPFPGVTMTTGGGDPTSHAAGQITSYLEPYKPYFKTVTSMTTVPKGPCTAITRTDPETKTQYQCHDLLFPGIADVVPGNPIGGAFTLPSGFINYQGTGTLYPSTAFAGYLTQSIIYSQNFQARFRPKNPHGATTTTRVTFEHNYPGGTTTTHGGLFDFSRNGYIDIEPGGNRFGGTMRYLYDEKSLFYQYLSIDDPLFFKAYGSFACTKQGVECTKSLEQTLGEATSSGMVSRFLLGNTIFTNTNTSTLRFASMTQYRKKAYTTSGSPPGVKNIITKNYYLDLRGPWTTGMIDVNITTGVSSMYGAHPTATGYDKTLGGSDITLTRTYTTVDYKGLGKTYYQTKKYYTTLKGVTRVVSLVTPRILHVYQVPRIPSDPILSNYAAPRAWIMKVFFLPEPTGALMLGAGFVLLLGLYRIRLR